MTLKHTSSIDFNELKQQGLTVIYKETETDEQPEGWEFWGKRKTPEEEVYVWRKIVALEEAETYTLEQADGVPL